MTSISPDKRCIESLKPPLLSSAWYDASVDITGHHISGLLIIKEMEKGLYRMVFTNEAGIKYFDFEMQGTSSFVVHHVMKVLDKKPILKTLEKDFRLILGLNWVDENFNCFKMNDEKYFGVALEKGSAYFVCDEECSSLHRLEIGSKRKKVASALFEKMNGNAPQKIVINHHSFEMTVQLDKLELQN